MKTKGKIFLILLNLLLVPSLSEFGYAYPNNELAAYYPYGNTDNRLAYNISLSESEIQEFYSGGKENTAHITADRIVQDEEPYQGNLYFPHVDTGDSWETEIAIINTSLDQTLTGNLRALSSEGQLVDIMEISLIPQARKQIAVGEGFSNPGDISYIIFEADSQGAVGYTKFYIEGQYRAMLPAVSKLNTGEIYVSHIVSNNNWWTGIGLINATSSSKDLTIEFDNGSTKDITLAPEAHSSFTVRSLFGGEPQTGISSAVIKNASGVVGLELFGGGNQLSGILLKDDVAGNLYFPHIANDSTWSTEIIAYNPSTASCTMTVSPYSAEGAPLAPQTFSIGGKGKYSAVLTNVNLPVSTFSTDAAWVKVSATQNITGFELFGTNDGNQMAGYTSVGISGKEGVFAKLEKDGWTGIAFVNAENGSATVTLSAYDDNGNAVEAEAMILGSYEKIVDSAENIFSGKDISNATYIIYSSDREVVGFQLNGSSDGMMLDGLPGMNSAYSGGASNNAPEAAITSPSDGDTYASGTSVTFSGSGYDEEDGNLTGSSLVWTSSIEGEIGTGTSFSKNDLSAGTHTITLTATDSQGATGSESVNITIQTASDAVLSIDTELLDFGASSTEMTFQIANIGSGSLEWTVSENDTWLSCNSASGDTSGDCSYSGTEDETITVTVDRSGLSQGTYSAFIWITSNGGDSSIVATMTVEEEEEEGYPDTVIKTILVGASPAAVAVTPDGSYVYVANGLSNTVSVIRTSDNTVRVTISVGADPRGIAVTPDGSYVYVTNKSSGTVSVIRTSDNTISNTIIVGAGPCGAAMTPDGSCVYVTNFDHNTISIIQTSDNTVLGTIEVGNGPRGVTVTPNGNYVYVANYFDDTISIIQTSDNTVLGTIEVGNGPIGAAMTPDGSCVYVTNYDDDTMSVIQTSDNTVLGTIEVGNGPRGVTVTPNGNYVYVANYFDDTISIIQTSDNTELDTVLPGDGPIDIAGTPDGTYMYVANYDDSTVSVIKTPENTVQDTVYVGDGPRGTAASPDGGYVYVTNGISNTVSVIQRSWNVIVDTISVGTDPRGVVVVPDGSYAYVANFDDDTVSAIQTLDNAVKEIIEVGDGPINIAVSPDGDYVYVTNYYSDTVSVIQTSDNTVTDTFSVGEGPIGIAATPEGGYVYVTNDADDTVSVIQTSDNTKVVDIAVGSEPIGIAITPDGGYGYVTNYRHNTVSVIQTSDNTELEIIDVGNGPRGIAVTPDGDYVYVTNYRHNTVSVIQTSDNTVVYTISVGNGPRGIAIIPEGSYAYVANFDDDTVSVIQTSK